MQNSHRTPTVSEKNPLYLRETHFIWEKPTLSGKNPLYQWKKWVFQINRLYLSEKVGLSDKVGFSPEKVGFSPEKPSLSEKKWVFPTMVTSACHIRATQKDGLGFQLR